MALAARLGCRASLRGLRLRPAQLKLVDKVHPDSCCIRNKVIEGGSVLKSLDLTKRSRI